MTALRLIALAAILALSATAAPAAAQDADATPPEEQSTGTEPTGTEPTTTEPTTTEPEDPEEPATTMRDDDARRDWRSPLPEASTSASRAGGVLGVVTILSLLGTVTGVGLWLERQDTLAGCERTEAADPRRGCVNHSAIREQRDLGIGLTVGLGTLSVGAALGWILLATLSPSEDPPALSCAPGLLSFGCAGVF